ncbi:MAG: M3 family oligoendopeptidase [Clostridiales bacterium]|jgi:pepF/M3 family oligoendopeptidase|nr:M3 family oligoendopeptidase [Clostridiales bacterium]
MDMRWSLDDLYTSFESEEFLADFETAKAEVADFGRWAEEAFGSADDAGAKLETYIGRINGGRAFMKLYAFAFLTRSVDEHNEAAKKYSDLLRGLMADMAKPSVLFKGFVAAVPNLDELIQASPVLKEHEFILREVVAQNKYLLSEKEEIAIAKMRITGSAAWADMKDMLLATMKIPVVIEGEEKELPLPAIRNLAHDANAETRKAAYYAEMKAYEDVERASAAALNAIKGEVLTQVALRGYESPLHMTLVNSRLEKDTLLAMISAMEDFLPSLRRFYKKKAMLLGHKSELPWYDLFAPSAKVKMKFTYQEAIDFVLEHFYAYSQEMGDFTKQAFEDKWVDAEVREGKRGGAFCANLHVIGQSRVVLNFTGSISNVTTMAHEFGHAYHGHCLKDASYMNTAYTMPIAETASTFCETIITDAAIKKADEDEKIAILEAEISDALQVIIDIYSRYLFESRLFEARKGGSLSVEEICNLMLQAQKDAYGDGMDHGCLHKYMWINKVHYYFAERNFYNFPYAYGLLFAKGLYAQYLAEGEGFLEKYNRLLAATGSNTLEAVGDLAGIDVRKKDFWVQSLKLIESKVDEFCK